MTTTSLAAAIHRDSCGLRCCGDCLRRAWALLDVAERFVRQVQAVQRQGELLLESPAEVARQLVAESVRPGVVLVEREEEWVI